MPPKKRKHDSMSSASSLLTDLNSTLIKLNVSDAPELYETSSSLDTWIHPIMPDDFFSKIFRQRALCVQGGGAARIERLCNESLGGLDIPDLLNASASDSVFVWVNPAGHDSPRARAYGVAAPCPLKSVDFEDSSSAATLHEAGHSAYCRAPPGVEQSLVQSLLRDTGLGLGCFDLRHPGAHDLARGEVEMFFSTAGHVTDWHYDFQENFTVQLSGAKRWRFARSPVSSPLRGHTPHYDSTPDVVESQLKAARLCPDGPAATGFTFEPPRSLRASDAWHHGKSNNGNPPSSSSSSSSSAAAAAVAVAVSSPPEEGTAAALQPEVQEVMLRAGDVLYFPSGMWHAVECLEEGVSLNVSLMANSWADLAAAAVRHALLKAPNARTPLCRFPPPLNNEFSAATPPSRTQEAAATAVAAVTTTQETNKSKKKTKKKRNQDYASSVSPSSNSSGSAGSSNSSGGDGVVGCTGDAARATAAAVLSEFRTVVAQLTVEDLLPFALSHPVPPLPEAARGLVTNRGEEEEEELGEGGEDNAEDDKDDEEKEDDPLIDVATFAVPEAVLAVLSRAGVRLRANPLAELIEEGELTRYYREQRALRGEESENSEEEEEEEEEEEGSVSSNDDEKEQEEQEEEEGSVDSSNNGDNEEGDESSDDEGGNKGKVPNPGQSVFESKQDNASSVVWIVNVNFGNDGLQSLVRARLCCNEKELDVQRLWRRFNGSNGGGETLDLRTAEESALANLGSGEVAQTAQGGAAESSKRAAARKLIGVLLYFGAISPV